MAQKILHVHLIVKKIYCNSTIFYVIFLGAAFYAPDKLLPIIILDIYLSTTP